MSLVSVLTLIFIVLKLTNLIHWSWIAVLSPIWINLLINLFIEVADNLSDNLFDDDNIY